MPRMYRHTALARTAAAAFTAAIAVLAMAAPASAHVTANATGATQGGYTKVTFRVPNERDNADTTIIEINLPADTPIASVSTKPLPGWTITSEKAKLPTPITTDDGQLTEAVNKIVWKADATNAIKPGQFQEFDVSLGPLPKTDQLAFKTLQTYSNGEIVRWIDVPQAGQDEPEHPAPVLELAAASTTTDAAAPSAAAGGATETDDEGTNWLGILGDALGVAGLIAGLLAYRHAAQSTT